MSKRELFERYICVFEGNSISDYEKLINDIKWELEKPDPVPVAFCAVKDWKFFKNARHNSAVVVYKESQHFKNPVALYTKDQL